MAGSVGEPKILVFEFEEYRGACGSCGTISPLFEFGNVYGGRNLEVNVIGKRKTMRWSTSKGRKPFGVKLKKDYGKRISVSLARRERMET